MTSKETKSEAIFRDLQHQKGEKPESKRKRFSRLILIFDALIILLVLFILTNRGEDTSIQTANITLKGTEINYTIAKIPETNDFIFGLTIKGVEKRGEKIYLTEGLARLKIMDEDKIILSEEIGPGIKSINLEQDETKIFTREINGNILNDYLVNVKKLKPKKRSIIDLTSKTFTFRSSVIIHYPEPVVIPLDFKYEVRND